MAPSPAPSETIELPRPGRYRHFKGRDYHLLSVARHTETDEWLAVYRSDDEPSKIWVRPLSMFLERVDGLNGRRRFEPTEEGPSPRLGPRLGRAFLSRLGRQAMPPLRSRGVRRA